ncbi:MAG: enoyl-CoA hydratase/isomerase family protein, partial [Promethearchaeota archaeon]
EGKSALIKLNRPEKLNALTYPMIMEINTLLESIKKEKKIRAIVIEGNGDGFCSGDDLDRMRPEGFKFTLLEDGLQIPHQKMLQMITTIPKPVIAHIHGFCFGAGFDLALACDFRIALDTMTIGDHRIKRAIAVLCGATWLLPRIVGLGRAIEIIQTGKHLTASEALSIGLVTRVYENENFPENSNTFIEYIANFPTKCFGYNK